MSWFIDSWFLMQASACEHSQDTACYGATLTQLLLLDSNSAVFFMCCLWQLLTSLWETPCFMNPGSMYVIIHCTNHPLYKVVMNVSIVTLWMNSGSQTRNVHSAALIHHWIRRSQDSGHSPRRRRRGHQRWCPDVARDWFQGCRSR